MLPSPTPIKWIILVVAWLWNKDGVSVSCEFEIRGFSRILGVDIDNVALGLLELMDGFGFPSKTPGVTILLFLVAGTGV